MVEKGLGVRSNEYWFKFKQYYCSNFGVLFIKNGCTMSFNDALQDTDILIVIYIKKICLLFINV